MFGFSRLQPFGCLSVCTWPSSCSSVTRFSSVQSLDRLGRRGRGRGIEILFQSFLQEDTVSSSRMARDAHSLMLSIQHFVCRPRRPEGWFWRGCCGVWHARAMQVSVSWQLSKEVPVGPQKKLIIIASQYCLLVLVLLYNVVVSWSTLSLFFNDSVVVAFSTLLLFDVVVAVHHRSRRCTFY